MTHQNQKGTYVASACIIHNNMYHLFSQDHWRSSLPISSTIFRLSYIGYAGIDMKPDIPRTSRRLPPGPMHGITPRREAPPSESPARDARDTLQRDMPVTTTVTGTHCLLELTGCSADLLNDEAFIRQAITDAAAAAGSTLLSLTSHAFAPQGVTALGLLGESHVSIHTWPEAGYAAADIFTCGSTCQPRAACDLLAERLRADNATIREFERGNAQ